MDLGKLMLFEHQQLSGWQPRQTSSGDALGALSCNYGGISQQTQYMLLAAKDARREGNEKGTPCVGTLPGTMQS